MLSFLAHYPLSLSLPPPLSLSPSPSPPLSPSLSLVDLLTQFVGVKMTKLKNWSKSVHNMDIALYQSGSFLSF